VFLGVEEQDISETASVPSSSEGGGEKTPIQLGPLEWDQLFLRGPTEEVSSTPLHGSTKTDPVSDTPRYYYGEQIKVYERQGM
jgi:hypothetical protein